MLECAEEVLRVTGSKSRICFQPLPTDDPKQRQPDTTRAREILGWSAKINLPEGLALTLPWFVKNLELENDSDTEPAVSA